MMEMDATSFVPEMSRYPALSFIYSSPSPLSYDFLSLSSLSLVIPYKLILLLLMSGLPFTECCAVGSYYVPIQYLYSFQKSA